MVMTTFLAIIFGTAMAGVLKELFHAVDAPKGQAATQLWIGSACCVVLAFAGTLTSLLIRRVKPAHPRLQFRLSALTIPPETRSFLARDRRLLLTLMATCVFWLVSGIAIQAVNSLGLRQLGVGDLRTSLMAAVIGLGIAAGAVLAGRLSQGRADFRLVRAGVWGIFLCLVVLSISLPGGRHLLGFWGSLPMLVLLGASAGMFAIPLQVFIQSRPPDDQKGRMIAVMNQFNFLAILLSGVVYSLFDHVVLAWQAPRSVIFAMMAAIILPVAVLYRPQNE
jgi:acyl-[acyl-carrier-protein]-phospholipid O-acyltransferase/long-chain-fatty-acid--[acyl-carrier-protein] ligase